ncbi:hypothetical protein BKI52_01895 [marine bacterium AO1-C]|nr:hypothetical protein BKI52_01895 [marine bacterium AO1-C]
MSNSVESVLLSQFITQAIPFDLITVKELHERCSLHNFDLSKPHRLRFNALMIVTEGKSKHLIDFKEQTVFPGVVLPLTKEQIHAFDLNNPFQGYVISFEEELITQNISEKNLFHFLHLFYTQSIVVQEEQLVELNPYLTLLKNAQKSAQLHLKSELIQSVLMALLFQIMQLSAMDKKTLESQRFLDFIRLKQLLRKHLYEFHNAKDYAQMLSVSYKYLNDICKENSNQTIKAFIDNWLMLEIKRLIIENKHSLQEIAFKMGFEEPSNFIRFFKKYAGQSPGQFKKENN